MGKLDSHFVILLFCLFAGIVSCSNETRKNPETVVAKGQLATAAVSSIDAAEILKKYRENHTLETNMLNFDFDEIANGTHTKELLESDQMEVIFEKLPPTRGYFYTNDPLVACARWGTLDQLKLMVSLKYGFVSSGDDLDVGHSVYEVAVEKKDSALLNYLLDQYKVPGDAILTRLFIMMVDDNEVGMMRELLRRSDWNAAIYEKYEADHQKAGGSVDDINTDETLIDRMDYVERYGSTEMKALLESSRIN